MDFWLTALFDAVIEPLSFLNNPGKRVFWGYLLSALLLFVLVSFASGDRCKALLCNSLKRKYWLGRNSLLDLKWITVNQIFALLLLTPLLIGQVAWAMANYRFWVALFGPGDIWHWPQSLVIGLFTVAIFVSEDFSRFLVHYAYHKIPLLWRFHAVHHSAKVMTPFTLYRIHFVEYAINSGRAVLVTGSVSGLFMYGFVGHIGLYEILGVSVFNLLFNLFGANLRHSHAWLPFGKAEKLLISPAMHQIHHSSAKGHLDKNFGASLAVWDRLFGSWLASQNQQVTRFGLYRQGNRQSLRKQLLGIPFSAPPKQQKAPYSDGASATLKRPQ